MPVNTGVLRGGPRRGSYSRSVAGSADVTLAAEELYEVIVLTGALTGNISVILPLGADDTFPFIIENQTTGNFSLGVKKPGGTASDIPQGRRLAFVFDGSTFGPEDTSIQVAAVSIAAAAIATLRATPVTLVAAPGAGKMIEFISAVLILDWVTPGFTESADNLVIGYVDASGKAASEVIEMTGFIDQVADTITFAVPDGGAATPIGTKAQIENAALVIYNNGDGEFGGSGGSALRIKVLYRVHSTGL